MGALYEKLRARHSEASQIARVISANVGYSSLVRLKESPN